MPRPKRTTTTRRNKGSVLDKGPSLKLKMWKAEIKDKLKMSLKSLDEMEREKLDLFSYSFRNSLMAIPKSVLNTKLDPLSDEFMHFFFNMDEDVENIPTTPPTITRTVKRRSRSAVNVKQKSTTAQKVRSSSIDVYKTPRGRVRLSSLMTNKKYTVSKPARKQPCSGLNVKRIMKAGEEAISTCGSPLYVAPGTLEAPQVNIPLPGGVVLNIEPKAANEVEFPKLDPAIKRQIKILYENLEKLF